MMIMALINSRNNPSVIMVIGRVSMIRIGLTRKLRRLNTTATMIAVMYESTETPGSTLARITTANAVNNTRKISFKKLV